MKKSVQTILILGVLIILATSGIKKVQHIGGITGQTVDGCTCHGDGITQTGSVSITGIPGTVVKGQTYTFNLVYNSGVTTKCWGLDVAASTGILGVGSNTNIRIENGEITHNSPVILTAKTNTFSGLKWTAPSTTGTVKFTFASMAGNNNGVNDFGDNWATNSFTATIAATTPVEFAFFNASWKGENKISLIWQTVTEINVDYYNIERSEDGYNYSVLTKIPATAISGSLKTYEISDNVLGSSKRIYYRIIAKNKIGESSYSETKMVNIKPVRNYVKGLYPNPVLSSQPVHIQYVAVESSKVTIELYSYLGRKLNSITINAMQGENDIIFKLGHFLTSGIYYVIVRNENNQVAELPLSVN